MHITFRSPYGPLFVTLISLIILTSFETLAEDHNISLEKDDPGTWVLFYIEAKPDADHLKRLGEYDSMLECFDAWTKAEDVLPKPKINFHIICIRTVEGHRPLVPS